VRRLFLVLATALSTAGGVHGESSLLGQYGAARQAFLGTAGNSGSFLRDYPQVVLADIDGLWLSLTVLFDEAQASDGAIATACTKLGMRIRQKSRYAFTGTRSAGTDHELDVIYSSMGGNRFSVFAEETQLFRFLGIDASKTDEASRTTVTNYLRSLNVPVTIFRPSPDILVIQPEGLSPQIFGRCSA